MEALGSSPTSLFDLINNAFVYQQAQFHSIVIKGAIWFRAVDITNFIGYKKSSDAVAKHVTDKNKSLLRVLVQDVENNGVVFTKQQLESTYINEAGFYRLVLRSRLPAAEAFSNYVETVILPGFRDVLRVRLMGEISQRDAKIDYLIKQNDEQLRALHEIRQQNDQLILRNELTLEKLDMTTDMAVPESKNGDLAEHFVLFRRKPVPGPYDFNYGVIRAQKRSIMRSLAKQRERFPDLHVLLDIDAQPNSVNLFNRFKESCDWASFTNTSIRLLFGTSEERLVTEIKRIHNKRKSPVNEVEEEVRRARVN